MLNLDLSGRTAVVTGGGRGIGAAVAERLSKAGANIVINDVNPAAKEFADSIGGLFISGDVRSPGDCENVVGFAADNYKTVDILINNAGITKDNLVLRMTEEAWDDVLDINLKGAFNMIKASSKIMTKARYGRIVNMSSVIGVMGNAGQANYAASKAGLIGLTKSCAKEFASRNINVNAIAPGFIESDMTNKLKDEVKEQYMKGIPLNRFGTASDIANVVSFLVSGAADYITGQVIHVDGGLVM